MRNKVKRKYLQWCRITLEIVYHILRYLANETTDGVVQSEFTFEKIVIKGNFPKVNVFTLPNSLNFNVSPYPTSDFTYVDETNAR